MSGHVLAPHSEGAVDSFEDLVVEAPPEITQSRRTPRT